MRIEGLDHVNIRCRESDLPAMRRFWGEALGLHEGDRPNFDAPGIWYWAGARAVVHIICRVPEGQPLPPAGGVFGHIALRADDMEGFRTRLAAAGIAWREAPVPGFPLMQFFMTDPVGIEVELTFPT